MVRSVIVCILLVFLGSQIAAMELKKCQVWSLPLVEMDEVVEGWFLTNNFTLKELESTDRKIHLNAVRGNQSWQVTLIPSSSLATKVDVAVVAEGREAVVINKLWEYLAVYTGAVEERSTNKNSFATAAVTKRLATTVLLRTTDGSGEEQFSGFFIGPYGIVLTTAHGINENSVVLAFTPDGNKHSVRVIALDKGADIAMLKVGMVPTSFVALADLRFDRQDDELLFAVGNPLNVQGLIASGVVYGGLRAFNGFPLWQLEMSVYPGSSGSPVFTSDGKLVGMVKGRHRTIPGIAFMIPIETVDGFLKGE